MLHCYPVTYSGKFYTYPLQNNNLQRKKIENQQAIRYHMVSLQCKHVLYQVMLQYVITESV